VAWVGLVEFMVVLRMGQGMVLKFGLLKTTVYALNSRVILFFSLPPFFRILDLPS